MQTHTEDERGRGSSSPLRHTLSCSIHFYYTSFDFGCELLLCTHAQIVFPFSRFILLSMNFLIFFTPSPILPYPPTASRHFSIRVGVFFPFVVIIAYLSFSFAWRKSLSEMWMREVKWAKKQKRMNRKKEEAKGGGRARLDKYHCMVEFLYKLCSRGLIKFLQQSIWFRFWCLQRTCVMVRMRRWWWQWQWL